MIGPLLANLARKRIVLASASPRRREILQSVVGIPVGVWIRSVDFFLVALQGLAFEVVPSTFEEGLDKHVFSTAHDYAKENARRKALDVVGKLKVSCNWYTTVL